MMMTMSGRRRKRRIIYHKTAIFLHLHSDDKTMGKSYTATIQYSPHSGYVRKSTV
jgi:hypothetical protein